MIVLGMFTWLSYAIYRCAYIHIYIQPSIIFIHILVAPNFKRELTKQTGNALNLSCTNCHDCNCPFHMLIEITMTTRVMGQYRRWIYWHVCFWPWPFLNRNIIPVVWLVYIGYVNPLSCSICFLVYCMSKHHWKYSFYIASLEQFMPQYL